MIDTLFVLSAVVIAGTGLRRSMRRRRRLDPGPATTDTPSLPDPFADGFYCLLLRDGSTRGGFVGDKPGGTETTIRNTSTSSSGTKKPGMPGTPGRLFV